MRDNIQNRILALVGLPLLALLAALLYLTYQNYERAKAYDKLLPLSALAVSGSDLVHMLQVERGSSVGLISSGGAVEFRDIVTKRRTLSDEKKSVFLQDAKNTDFSYYNPLLEQKISSVISELEKLGDHRNRVDQLSLTVPENVKYYTQIILHIADVIGVMQKLSTDQELTRKLIVYRNLVLAKEKAGLERAIGANLLNKGTYVATVHQTYLRLLNEQNVYLAEANLFANDAERQSFADTVTGPEVNQVIEWRQVLIALDKTFDTGGIDGAVWFKTATTRVNQMKQFEDQIAGKIIQQAETKSAQAWSRVYLGSAVAILSIVIVSAFALLIIWGTVRPLSRISRCLLRLSDGEIDVEIPEKVTGGSEIRTLAAALKIFQNNMYERVRLEKAQLEKDKEMQKQRSELLMNMAQQVQDRIGSLIRNLASSTQFLETKANELGTVSNQGGSRSLSVADSADVASVKVEGIAASSVQISMSVSAIYKKAEVANSHIQSAEGVVLKAEQTLNGLVDAADDIGTVVALIDDIAGQTNLLALNATIEAARAGEYGKGFAVVASEVKKLSTQTSDATDRISGQISQLQTRTQNVAKDVGEIATSIRSLTNLVREIAGEMDQQATAVEEMKKNVEAAAGEAASVSRDISVVSQSNARSCGNAISTLWATEDLKKVERNLNAEVEEFAFQLRGQAAE